MFVVLTLHKKLIKLIKNKDGEVFFCENKTNFFSRTQENRKCHRNIILMTIPSHSPTTLITHW